MLIENINQSTIQHSNWTIHKIKTELKLLKAVPQKILTPQRANLQSNWRRILGIAVNPGSWVSVHYPAIRRVPENHNTVMISRVTINWSCRTFQTDVPPCCCITDWYCCRYDIFELFSLHLWSRNWRPWQNLAAVIELVITWRFQAQWLQGWDVPVVAYLAF